MTVQSSPLDTIIEALELDLLEPEEQEEIMGDIGSIIFQGSMIRLMEVMEPTTKEEFGKLVDANVTEEELATFITSNVEGADRIVSETIQYMTQDILTVTGYAA